MKYEVLEMAELISAECKRVEWLLSKLEVNEYGRVNIYYNPIVPELKNKMHELRRDMLSLEKMLYGK